MTQTGGREHFSDHSYDKRKKEEKKIYVSDYRSLSEQSNIRGKEFKRLVLFMLGSKKRPGDEAIGDNA